MAQRKLALRKETLTELSTVELTQVVGASGVKCLTGTPCNSDFQQCITGVHCVPTLDSCITPNTNLL